MPGDLEDPHPDALPAGSDSGLADDGARWHPSSLERPHPARNRRRRRWVQVGGVAAAVALLTSLLAFGLSRDPTVVRSALLGKPAPAFDLPSLDGRSPVRLASLRGQVVVVNFWASWCADCRLEHPSLVAAWQRYQDQGVVLVGIPFQDRVAASRRFARDLRMGWPLVLDPGSRTALAYGVYGVPETFVISPAGRVVYKQVGPIPYPILIDQITRALRPGTA
jgi:cytochrome c biogenesis protein CcmG/thiol:disulfide interchange protein DsbE